MSEEISAAVDSNTQTDELETQVDAIEAVNGLHEVVDGLQELVDSVRAEAEDSNNSSDQPTHILVDRRHGLVDFSNRYFR